MSGIEVEFTRDNFAVIHMKKGENRLNPEFIDAFSAALDQVERNVSCQALITVGDGKFYSNGLDLQYMSTVDSSYIPQWMLKIQQFLNRLLTFPMPTVAVINGHAFAGGAFLAVAHDFRVMRTGQGWMCWNEIFIKLRFPDYLMELLRTKVPPGTAQLEAAVYGKRFTAEEACQSGFVDIATRPDRLMTEAKTLIKKSMGKEPYDRKVMKAFKEDLYSKLTEMAPRVSKSKL